MCQPSTMRGRRRSVLIFITAQTFCRRIDAIAGSFDPFDVMVQRPCSSNTRSGVSQPHLALLCDSEKFKGPNKPESAQIDSEKFKAQIGPNRSELLRNGANR